MKKLAMLVVTLVVTAGMVAYAFWDVDIRELAALMGRGDYWILLPFEVLLFLFYWNTAFAWTLLLKPLGRFGIKQVTPAMMVGFGGNNVLPAHMGELVRVVVFALRHKLSRSSVLVTLVAERMLDAFAVILIFFVTSLALETGPGALQTALRSSAAVVGLAILGLLVFLRYPELFTRLWDFVSRPLPQRLAALGHRFLTGCEAGLAALKSPTALLSLSLLAVLKWGTQSVMAWLTLYSYGVTVSPALAALAVAVSAVAVALPSTPGFFGIIQAAFVFSLTPFGISQEVALAASVLYLFAQWVPVTLVGLACFFATGLKPATVRHEMEE